LGIGAFNGLTTWLEAIVEPQGIDADGAGMIGGVLIFGGIAGAVVVPLLSDWAKKRHPFLVACAVGAAALIAPLGILSSYAALLAIAGLLGFAFLPALAILLDMSAQLAGAARAGAATGLIMLAGNAGGVVLILAVPFAKAGKSYLPAVALLAVLLAVGAVLAALAPETYPKPAASAPADDAKRESA
jgi:hypothetical protein